MDESEGDGEPEALPPAKKAKKAKGKKGGKNSKGGKDDKTSKNNDKNKKGEKGKGTDESAFASALAAAFAPVAAKLSDAAQHITEAASRQHEQPRALTPYAPAPSHFQPPSHGLGSASASTSQAQFVPTGIACALMAMERAKTALYSTALQQQQVAMQSQALDIAQQALAMSSGAVLPFGLLPDPVQPQQPQPLAAVGAALGAPSEASTARRKRKRLR